MRRSMVFTIVMLFIFAVTHPTWAQTTPSVTGTVQQYLLNPHGEMDGLLLSDGTVVKSLRTSESRWPRASKPVTPSRRSASLDRTRRKGVR